MLNGEDCHADALYAETSNSTVPGKYICIKTCVYMHDKSTRTREAQEANTELKNVASTLKSLYYTLLSSAVLRQRKSSVALNKLQVHHPNNFPS